MNTNRTTQAPALHHSARTSINMKTDPMTGRQERVLTTSVLRMEWRAGDLAMQFSARDVYLGTADALRRRLHRRVER